MPQSTAFANKSPPIPRWGRAYRLGKEELLKFRNLLGGLESLELELSRKVLLVLTND